MKTLLKSPNMSRLHGHHHGHRTHGTISPDMSTATTPMTSPPSLERNTGTPVLPTIPISNSTLRPPPAVAPAMDRPASVPVQPNVEDTAPLPNSKHSWKLKGIVAVIRHADRTPKQKFKFTFHSQPFVDLLKGHHEEVLLKGEAALASVLDAVKVAIEQRLEDPDKLRLLRTSLARKGSWPGTKVQIKPMFRKRKPTDGPLGMSPLTPQTSVAAHGGNANERESSNGITQLQMSAEPTSTNHFQPDAVRTQSRSDSISGVTFSRFSAVENDLILDKLQLVIKWGGEPTHSARYQAQDLGLNMRDDLKLMNKNALNDVKIFTSSEPRVSTSGKSLDVLLGFCG